MDSSSLGFLGVVVGFLFELLLELELALGSIWAFL